MRTGREGRGDEMKREEKRSEEKRRRGGEKRGQKMRRVHNTTYCSKYSTCLCVRMRVLAATETRSGPPRAGSQDRGSRRTQTSGSGGTRTGPCRVLVSFLVLIVIDKV